uniref:Uncharacterized protein n=1 Tax=Arundo donax TaxID=35708 RepID=A0A0A9H1Y0_ARUDO
MLAAMKRMTQKCDTCSRLANTSWWKITKFHKNTDFSVAEIEKYEYAIG